VKTILIGLALLAAACAPGAFAARDGEAVYKAQCAMCHNGGNERAPRREAFFYVREDRLTKKRVRGRIFERFREIGNDRAVRIPVVAEKGQRIAHDDATNNIYIFYGSDFKTLESVIGWDWDTRNRTLFADRGFRQSISAAVTFNCAWVSSTIEAKLKS